MSTARADRLADYSTDRRVLVLSAAAIGIGARHAGHQQRGKVLEAGTKDPFVAFPDELLSETVDRMLRHDIGRLPVVEREHPKRLVGYLGRSGVMAARVRLYEEENLRERG